MIAWVFVLCDLIADSVYLLDIVVQFHTAYLEDGITVSNPRTTKFSSGRFFNQSLPMFKN